MKRFSLLWEYHTGIVSSSQAASKDVSFHQQFCWKARRSSTVLACDRT